MKGLGRYWRKLELKWVLLALCSALVALIAIMELVPSLNHLVYDKFLWKYITGPIMADWQGQPVTQGEVVAYAGYNFVNTVVYALLGLAIFYSIYKTVSIYEIKLDSRFFFSALPLIVLGGLARAGEDLGITGGLGPLFITPLIYFLLAGGALLLIFISRHTKSNLNKLFLGTSLAVISLYSLFFLLNAPNYAASFNLNQLGFIIGIATLATAAVYALGRSLTLRMLTRASYITILFGHLLDASQSYIGMHGGYKEKMVLPNLLTGLTGPYAIFLLKLGLLLPILYLLEKETVAGRVNTNFRVLFLLAVTALGLPQGIRGALRIFLGV